MAYTHASLFSGIGGAELAAQWMGWDNVFHCEIEEFQRKVLAYWFPNSVSYEDITKTDFTGWRGKIDVLTGGFPCQPFSVAGKRKGADDNRYLWKEMLRAIRQIQPTWIVGENVAGIISMVQPGETVKMGRTDNLFEESFIYRTEQQFELEAICQDLENAGYAVQPFVIPACAVGAPHRRDRVWIIANRTNAGIESLQQGWQDGVSEVRLASHTQVAGSTWKLLGQQTQIQPDRQNRRIVTNTKCSGGYKVDEEIQSEITDGERAYSHGVFGETSNKADRLQHWWKDFPSQSPVCGRDDGLPFRVADLTISFPQWRRKSIEALGNAWVPQVAHEIFKAIEISENRQIE